MPTPQEKLADSLSKLKELQDDGRIAIRSRDLPRTHRERLSNNGFLQEVIKGWYIASNPSDTVGETTPWYSSFWNFCVDYLSERFEDDWCLSPEQSILIHVGNRTVPPQLQVRSPGARNKPTQLLHGTSVFDVKLKLPESVDIVEGLRVFKLPQALVDAVPRFFRQHPTDARAALATFRDTSRLLGILLEGGHSRIAGRLCGAFRNVGRDHVADEIAQTMKSAGYDVRESDPFEDVAIPIVAPRGDSPQAGRLRLMWQQMRDDIIEVFPAPPKTRKTAKTYLSQVEDVFASDAYHSLSIEGYRVSPDLIERVRKGDWNPDENDSDRQQQDALAARGYYQAFLAVKQSVQSVLERENAGEVAGRDHGTWYREMFAPLVSAGLLAPGHLAGYRTNRVYLRGSRHVPVAGDAVGDLMPVFFELLSGETDPAVRVVLGHFLFVYIHPYMDGNGRIGRFLMNVMLASGRYPWTVIQVDDRDDYMEALEAASVGMDILPFAKFLARVVG